MDHFRPGVPLGLDAIGPSSKRQLEDQPPFPMQPLIQRLAQAHVR